LDFVQSGWPWPKRIYIGILSLLIILSPFFRGLFFEREFLLFLLGFLVLFMFFYLSFFLNNDNRFLDSLNDYMALGLLFAYLISSFGAVNVRDALGSTLRMTGFFVVFYIIAHGLRNKRDIRFFLNVLYIAGVGTALTGLGTALKILNIEAAFQDERIYSVLQYPNTLASFVTAALILGICLATQNKNRWFPVLYGIGNYILMLTFIGAKSRGGILIFALIVVALMAGPWGLSRWKLVLQIILTIVIGVVVSGKIFGGSVEHYDSILVAWAVAGALIGGILAFTIEYLGEKVSSRWPEQDKKIGLLLVVLIILFGIALAASAKYGVLPAEVTSRFKAISLQERNVQERFVFYNDAFKIIKDYPILGAGGGAWRSLFGKYQSYHYISREIHSHFIQVWLETGIIGLAFLIGVWAAFLRSIIRVLKNKKEDNEIKGLAWAIMWSALALGMHGLIDFNLSMGAVSIFLWALFGLGRGLESVLDEEKSAAVLLKKKHRVIQHIAVLGCLALVFVSAASFSIAIYYSIKNKEALAQNDITSFRHNLEMAVKYDPFNSPTHVYMTQVYAQIGEKNGDEELIHKALYHANKAVELNRYDPTIREIRARLLLADTQISSGVEDMEKAMEYNPWNQEYWGMLAETYYQVGLYYMEKGSKRPAREYFEKVIEIPDRITAQLSILEPKHRQLWEQSPTRPVLGTNAYIIELFARSEANLNRL